MKQIVYFFLIILMFASCTYHTKKILVVMKSGGSVDANTQTVILKDGGGTEEKILQLNSAKKIILTLQKEIGKSTVEIAEDGYYLLNGKNDTIIGSYQKYGVVSDTFKTVSQAEIKNKIDSLQLLIENKNISAANRNYFIPPYQVVKISSNLDAFIVSPFHRMVSVEKVGEKDPEVYRFWSSKEIRETINKLKAMTVSKK